MKPRDFLTLILRLVVGSVLIYAGASKTSSPTEEFAYIIQAYDLIPAALALPMAGLLPWVELLVGWSLVLGVETRLSSAAAGGLFAMFFVAVGSALARGIGLPNCGCFGEGMHFSLGQTLAFDSVMLISCYTAFRYAPDAISVDRWIHRGI
jgi:uncharacterized membrane protein YphA (DoxX/SURF4 family)